MVIEDGDVTAVVAALDGREWVNLGPELADEAEAPASASGLFGSLFSSRGPAVPLCTWHRGERMLGIQHAAGPHAGRRVAVPDGWRVTQDHPRRGLVVRVPPDVGDTAVLTWLLAAGAELCPLPCTGRWVAEIRG